MCAAIGPVAHKRYDTTHEKHKKQHHDGNVVHKSWSIAYTFRVDRECGWWRLAVLARAPHIKSVQKHDQTLKKSTLWRARAHFFLFIVRRYTANSNTIHVWLRIPYQEKCFIFLFRFEWFWRRCTHRANMKTERFSHVKHKAFLDNLKLKWVSIHWIDR